MTREEAKETLPLIQAFVEGKQIESRLKRNSIAGWVETTTPIWSNDFDYRIKPTPTLRPWTQSETPMPCVVRYKTNITANFLITAAVKDGVWIGTGNQPKDRLSYSRLLVEFDCTTDQGITWKPCGTYSDE